MTTLNLEAQKKNFEIIQLLLNNPQISVNELYV